MSSLFLACCVFFSREANQYTYFSEFSQHMEESTNLCAWVQYFCPQTYIPYNYAHSVFWSMARALCLPNTEFTNNYLLRATGYRAASVNGHSLFIFTTPQGEKAKKRCHQQGSSIKRQNTMAGRSHKKTTFLISAAFGTSLQFARLSKHRASSQT